MARLVRLDDAGAPMCPHCRLDLTPTTRFVLVPGHDTCSCCGKRYRLDPQAAAAGNRHRGRRLERRRAVDAARMEEKIQALIDLGLVSLLCDALLSEV